MKDTVLAISLSAAVPIWQQQLKSVPMDQLLERARDAGKLIAFKGDVLMYGSKVKGEAADLFNRTAEAIAILSFMPGGIKVFGQHWEGQHD